MQRTQKTCGVHTRQQRLGPTCTFLSFLAFTEIRPPQLAVSPFLSHSNVGILGKKLSGIHFTDTLHKTVQAPSGTWRTRSKRSQRHARNGSDAQKRAGAHGRLMARKRPWSKLQCSNTFCGSQSARSPRTARRAAPRPAAASRRGSKPRRDGPIG